MPAWKTAKTAKIPISITVIEQSSSIMPKPCSDRARELKRLRRRNTAQVIGTGGLPLKAKAGDADFTRGNGLLRLHGDQRVGTRARRAGQRARPERGAGSSAPARARRPL